MTERGNSSKKSEKENRQDADYENQSMVDNFRRGEWSEATRKVRLKRTEG